MGKKRNLSEGLNQEDKDFIDERMRRQIGDGDAGYSNWLKALSYKIDLKCKNKKQKEFAHLIKDNKIVFCSGSAGVGKSFVTASIALQQLRDNEEIKKIVIVVPTIQSDLEIGFVKGTVEDKLFVHAEQFLCTMEKVLNLSGNNGKAVLGTLLKEGFVEVRCVSFLRGFSLSGVFTIITESQQFPQSAFKTILTRYEGPHSKFIFEGDLEQCDNKDIKKSKGECGLKYAMDKLKDIDGIGVVEFGREDIVRDKIIIDILYAWG
jgi:phosphate starvation-inducible PhoH-like protein